MKIYVKTSSSSNIDCDKIYNEVRDYLKEHFGRLTINTSEILVYLTEDGYGYIKFEDLCNGLRDPEILDDYNEYGIELLAEDICDIFNADEALEIFKQYGKKPPKWLLKEAGYLPNPDIDRY